MKPVSFFVALLLVFEGSSVGANPRSSKPASQVPETVISPADKPTAPSARANTVTTFDLDAISPSTIETPSELEDLLDIRDVPPSLTITDEDDVARLRLVREVGFSAGVAKGFARQLNKEIARIKEAEAALDSWLSFRDIFNMAGRHIDVEPGLYWQPPVIAEVSDVIEIGEDGRSLTTVDGIYRIIKGDRFVAVPPRWQDYLFAPPPHYDNSIYRVSLPKTAKERLVWREAVLQGWQQGIYQATDEMRTRIANLRRDLDGMLAFIELQAKGQIRAGYIAAQRKDVAGGGDEMSIGMRRYHITNPTFLNTDTNQWQTYASKHPNSIYEKAGVRVFRDHNRCVPGDLISCP